MKSGNLPYRLLLVFCLIIVGCRSTELHLYDDKPPPPIHELSKLLIPAGIDIRSVDDKKNDIVHYKRSRFMSAGNHATGQRTLVLKPGQHTVRFRLYRHMWLQTGTDQDHSHEIPFETWPGKSYRLMYTVVTANDRENFSVQAWIEKQAAQNTCEALNNTIRFARLTIKRENWNSREIDPIQTDYYASSWPDTGLVVFSSVMKRKCLPFPIEFTFSEVNEINKAFIDDDKFRRWKPDLQIMPCVTMYIPSKLIFLNNGKSPTRPIKPGDTLPDDRDVGTLHVLPLRAGSYASHGFFHDRLSKVATSAGVFTQNEYHSKPHCFPFEVKPGMITYLGSFTAYVGRTRMELMKGRGDTMVTDTRIVVEDQRKRDLQLFKKSYPKTGVSSAVITLLK